MEKINLSIVTPCINPKNLNTIQDSILKANANVDEIFQIIWYIIFDHEGTWGPSNTLKVLYDNPYAFMRPYVKMKDGNVVHAWGYPQRNYALNEINKGWVLFLNDNDTLPEQILCSLLERINQYPINKGVTFCIDPYFQDNKPYFILDRECIGNLRFDEDKQDAEKLFIEKLNEDLYDYE